MVQVDSDCDGYTSSALLLNYIYARFPSAINKFVYMLHDNKVHGIDVSAIPATTSLVIAPDSSSNEYDIHKELQSKGIDALVLDHHQADKISEYACVVNNQLCDYPTKSLSGVGIVYKLCQYIDSLFGDNIVDRFLDIVGVGLTGDMVDMRDFETHYLTQKGLNSLNNPFIKGMAEKNGRQIGDTISPIKVAFYIVPLVNSITRVGTMAEKRLLFESMLEWKAYEMVPSTKRGHSPGAQETIVEQSLRTCTNVKNRQTREQENAVNIVRQQIEQENLLAHKVLVIKINNPSFDRGITGLIANKLMSEYQRPVALLIAGTHNGKPCWTGSARGYDKSELTDFRQLCRNSRLTFLSDGHPSAFGLGVYDQDIEDFIAYCDEALKDIDFKRLYRVDAIYSSQSINPNDVIAVGGMTALWGQNVDEPLIVIENISVTKDMLFLMARDTHPTLKITLPNGISLIKFKSSEEEYNSLYSETGCTTITVIGKCERNVFNGRTSPQIIVEEYEIVDKKDYYF